MSALAEFMILSGGDNRLPMLEKHLYQQSAKKFFQPKTTSNYSWWKGDRLTGSVETKLICCWDKVLLVEAQGSRKVPNEEELDFLADPGVVEGLVTHTVITHNAAYQADDLDAYDSDSDDFSTTKAALMANLSSYGSNVLSKEKEAKNIDKEIALEKKVKELDNIICKMGQFAQTVPMLYDGSVISKETNVISIVDSEENLMFEEESQSKMILKQSDPMVLEKKVNIKPINYAELNRLSKDFGKRFIPQQELSYKQAFRLQTSHPNTDQSAFSRVKIKAPRELPKKQLLIKNDRVLDEIISQDIVNIVVNSSMDMNT
nr:hypothetical protein [Tanacetum cinerariifolium]